MSDPRLGHRCARCGAVILLALVACGGTDDTTTDDRPGDPDVYRRIEAETDCAALQEQFNIAAENHARNLARDRLDLAEVSTSYMEAADERMQDLDC